MVKAVFRIAALVAVALPVLLSAKDLGEYQFGDKVEEDIVATSKLSFLDIDSTQAERDREAQRVPLIIRYYTNAADEAEVRFREAFVKTHEDFLRSVEKTFGHRTLSDEEIASFRFQSLAMLFQKQNTSFPLSTNRAAKWAGGDEDKVFQDALAAKLRRAMMQVIRPEPLPPGFRLGSTVRLIPVGATNDVISEQEALQTNRNFAAASFALLATVRRNVGATLPRDERDAARFFSALVEPNCHLDEAVTRQLRAKSTENVWLMCTYEPGQVVAHRGDVVDRKIKTAIDLLKEKTVVRELQDLQVKQQATVGELQQLMAEKKAKDAQAQEHTRELQEMQAKQQATVGELQQLLAENRAKDARAQEHVLWLVGTLAAVVVILAAATWQLARRRHPVTMLPATVGDAAEWQQRALVAEQRTQNLQSAARAGLIAHLSQWFSRMLTQRLVFQRRMLLETHDNAAAEMAALEERLEKVQAPLQVRLAAYEHRITELEKELAVRGEENRELLKAKIEMMRKQLEAARGKNRVEFN